MVRTPLSALMFALLASAVAGGCTKPSAVDAEATPDASAQAATPAAEPAPADSGRTQADVFRFRIGALEAAALKDGDIDLPNDGSVFGVGAPATDVKALLDATGLDSGTLHLSVQPLLVRAGARVLLFDTGAGKAEFARAGRLQASLREAGVEPGQVTDVFISHAHPDHVGGLLTDAGTPAFPAATVHISAPEWSALKQRAEAAPLAAAIEAKVAAFEPGAAVVPGVVTAVAVDGHTPGHSAYEIASADAKLLYVGDTVHHHVISVRRPQWRVAFDGDAPLAETSRAALLQRAADARLRLYSVHFPFPGLGHVEAGDDGFTWVAER